MLLGRDEMTDLCVHFRTVLYLSFPPSLPYFFPSPPILGLSASSSSPQGEGNCARRRSHASGGAMVDRQVRFSREREKERMEREVWRQEGGGGATTRL